MNDYDQGNSGVGEAVALDPDLFEANFILGLDISEQTAGRAGHNVHGTGSPH